MTHGNTVGVREQSKSLNRRQWAFQRGWAAPCQPWFRIYRWSPEHMPHWGYWGLVLGKREYRLWWDGEGANDASEEACCRIINLAEQMTPGDIRKMADYFNELAALEEKRPSEKHDRYSDTRRWAKIGGEHYLRCEDDGVSVSVEPPIAFRPGPCAACGGDILDMGTRTGGKWYHNECAAAKENQ